MADAGILEAIARLEQTIEPSSALEARVAELERSAARAEGRAEGAGPPVAAATIATSTTHTMDCLVVPYFTRTSTTSPSL